MAIDSGLLYTIPSPFSGQDLECISLYRDAELLLLLNLKRESLTLGPDNTRDNP
jgi:hypothetical protein